MSFSYPRPRARKGERVREMRPAGPGLEALLGKRAAPEAGHLFRLWQNWGMVMGPELADLAIPLGTRHKMLLVGGEDNMALQELSYYAEEILERVNAFMDAPSFAPCFERVELHLLSQRQRLDAPPAIQPATRRRLLPFRPAALSGTALAAEADSPVKRAYEAFVRMHERLRGGVVPGVDSF